MSCSNCNRTEVRGGCRVCELVDGNTNIQRVFYCEDCQAYICYECEYNLIRRGIAFAKDTAGKISAKIQNLL